jgi:hypothetical protein
MGVGTCVLGIGVLGASVGGIVEGFTVGTSVVGTSEGFTVGAEDGRGLGARVGNRVAYRVGAKDHGCCGAKTVPGSMVV